jgi:hypothetical protein
MRENALRWPLRQPTCRGAAAPTNYHGLLIAVPLNRQPNKQARHINEILRFMLHWPLSRLSGFNRVLKSGRSRCTLSAAFYVTDNCSFEINFTQGRWFVVDLPVTIFAVLRALGTCR